MVLTPDKIIMLGFAIVVSVIGFGYIAVVLIRDWFRRRAIVETLESSCGGCVHLYFDKNDKPKCDLAMGGWCGPDICTWYKSSKY